MRGFNKEDSTELGFAVQCIMARAITMDEFKEWLYHVIAKYDDLPTYMYMLPDCKDLDAIDHEVPFIYGSGLSYREMDALLGIAVKRGVDINPLKDSMRNSTALRRLEKCPHIEERFRKTFPFIKF